MLAAESTSARDVTGAVKRLSDQQTNFPVVGCLPVVSLMLDLLQGRLPAGNEVRPAPGE